MTTQKTVTLTVTLKVELDEGVDLEHALGEMTYSFDMTTEGSRVIEEQIEDWTW